MNNRVLLIVTSLVTMLLFTLHWIQDVQWGLDQASPANFGLVLILLVWLCATLVWPHRRAGLIVLLILSLLSVGVTVLHIRSASYLRLAATEGGLPFVWTLIMVGAGGAFGSVLAVRGLLEMKKGVA